MADQHDRSNQASFIDQRHQRVACQIDVDVEAGLTRERANCIDLSGGGIFVASDRPYVPGQVVHLKIRIDHRFIQTDAEVVHTQSKLGFGARFLTLTHDQRRHLIRFVHRNRATLEAERVLSDEVLRMLDSLSPAGVGG